MGVKISELNEATSAQNSDVLPIVQNGETKKISVETLGIANIDTKINSKQDKLTAGTGIEITGGNIINNLNANYSTNEQKIGKWINGKPLYRKVIIINNTALNKGDNTIAHGISNMDKGIKITCFNYSGVILPYINLNADSSLKTATFITGINSTNIVFRVINDSWGAQNNWYVTIYYTKTTD